MLFVIRIIAIINSRSIIRVISTVPEKTIRINRVIEAIGIRTLAEIIIIYWKIIKIIEIIRRADSLITSILECLNETVLKTIRIIS